MSRPDPLTAEAAADLAAEPLTDLLTRIGVVDPHWDYLVVGDGSGSKWGHAMGWASVSIERETGLRWTWLGSGNAGTVNFAEIMAYLQPLTWLVAREDALRKAGRKAAAKRVHIITDSQYCQIAGTEAAAGNVKAMKPNAGLWALFRIFRLSGFILTWHWLPRATSGLNEFADYFSKVARATAKPYNSDGIADDAGRTAYDVNPSG